MRVIGIILIGLAGYSVLRMLVDGTVVLEALLIYGLVALAGFFVSRTADKRDNVTRPPFQR